MTEQKKAAQASNVKREHEKKNEIFKIGFFFFANSDENPANIMLLQEYQRLEKYRATDSNEQWFKDAELELHKLTAARSAYLDALANLYPKRGADGKLTKGAPIEPKYEVVYSSSDRTH